MRVASSRQQVIRHARCQTLPFEMGTGGTTRKNAGNAILLNRLRRAELGRMCASVAA
jgi:hypothetical protein